MYKIVLLSYLHKFIIIDQIAMDSNKPKSRITGVGFAFIYFATVSQNTFFWSLAGINHMCSLFFP